MAFQSVLLFMMVDVMGKIYNIDLTGIDWLIDARFSASKICFWNPFVKFLFYIVNKKSFDINIFL